MLAHVLATPDNFTIRNSVTFTNASESFHRITSSCLLNHSPERPPTRRNPQVSLPPVPPATTAATVEPVACTTVTTPSTASNIVVTAHPAERQKELVEAAKVYLKERWPDHPLPDFPTEVISAIWWEHNVPGFHYPGRIL